jgi:hypothetical protein
VSVSFQDEELAGPIVVAYVEYCRRLKAFQAFALVDLILDFKEVFAIEFSLIDALHELLLREIVNRSEFFADSCQAHGSAGNEIGVPVDVVADASVLGGNRF